MNTFKNKSKKIFVRVFDNRQNGSVFVARQIATLIKNRNCLNQSTILGLATGNTPVLVYKELIRLHKQEGLSFKNVVTFNLDEYFPMSSVDSHSYHKFMFVNFFSHIDINPENIHIPEGTLPYQEIDTYCNGYDKRIELLGGLDVLLLGIGRSGHIGFNEPGSLPSDGTRLVNLDRITIDDASVAFGGAENVPVRAITMGVKTILKSKKIFLMAWGQKKADVVFKAVEGEISTEVPATFLQRHNNCVFVLDTQAASRLNNY